MKTLIAILPILISITCFGQQQKQVAYKKTDYPATKFLITSDTLIFEQVQIITTMVTPKESSNGFLCRSWLKVIKNNKILKQKFYEIEPVGGCSGLFLPSIQPLENYLIISKFGDYKGQTLLINTSGKLLELTGGSFSVSTDKKYLFSLWDSDLSGITVLDLTKEKTIFSKEVEEDKPYNEIYFQDGKYYVSYFEDNAIALLDITSKKVVTINKTLGFLKKENKLELFNDIQALTKCNCGRK